jgi:hypothetical protein
MPTITAEQQKRFRLTLVDGLPQATVESKGTVRWVKCCPLCGCTHQVLMVVDETVPYTPPCQTAPLLYKTLQAIWLKLYPDVSQYASVQLVQEVSK